MIGHKLAALDGEFGHVKDFYFDDHRWTVRYLVADTGNWLPQRKVLISPLAVRGLQMTPHNSLAISLTRKQIEESPSIEAHKPISRQFEEKYSQYYGWPYYWPGPMLWGPIPYPGLYMPVLPPAQPPRENKSSGPDSYLRSTEEVRGYGIQALDQHFGHIEEFIVEEETWAIRYLEIDTRNWWPGKKVLLSPEWISSVSWSELRVYIDLDRQTVQRAPEYDPASVITRQYEEKLFAYYNREPYWRAEGAKAAA